MLIALLLTVIIEFIALCLLGERNWLFFIYWTAVTAFTNLCANLYINVFFSGSGVEYFFTVVIIEALVFLIEFLLCRVYTGDKKKSLKYSAICNAASYFIGSIILFIIK